jgi:hypothetical protein
MFDPRWPGLFSRRCPPLPDFRMDITEIRSIPWQARSSLYYLARTDQRLSRDPMPDAVTIRSTNPNFLKQKGHRAREAPFPCT